MTWLKRSAKLFYATVPFKQQLFTVLRSLVPVPVGLYRHLHFKGVFTVEISPSERFRVRHHGYMIENEFFWRGIEGWEKVSLELWLRLCRQSNVIFDIGANTGVYSLAAHAVAPRSTVVAAEPVARVFANLENNIALNEANIILVRAAISDHSGTAILYDKSDSDHVLSVSLDPEWNSSNKNLRPVEVPCLTVMDLLERTGKTTVDLMKIGVETHEPWVLEGCKELIRRDRPSLLIEKHFSQGDFRKRTVKDQPSA